MNARCPVTDLGRTDDLTIAQRVREISQCTSITVPVPSLYLVVMSSKSMASRAITYWPSGTHTVGKDRKSRSLQIHGLGARWLGGSSRTNHAIDPYDIHLRKHQSSPGAWIHKPIARRVTSQRLLDLATLPAVLPNVPEISGPNTSSLEH